MLTLSHRSTIRTTDAPAYVTHVVITSKGKDAEYNKPGMHNDPPCVIRPASVLSTCSDTHAQQDADRAACIVVANGDVVSIEGAAYRVEYRPGSWRYSDGIELVPLDRTA